LTAEPAITTPGPVASSPAGTGKAPPLESLLRAAERRRRLRSVVSGAALSLWPGLVVSIILAVAWRLIGGEHLLAASAAVVLVSAVAGAVSGLRREDLLAAAAELDRRAGLEAALATGLEVCTGRIGGTLAAAALLEAERASSGIGPGEIPFAPPSWARYLVLPAAVLAGVALVPRGRPPDLRPAVGGRLAARGAAGGEAHAAREDAAGPRAEARALTPEERRALAEEYRRRKTEAVPAAELPAPPPSRRPRARSKADEGARVRPGEGEKTDGAGGGGLPESTEDVTRPLGGGAGGPLDRGEAAVVRERFPEYADVVRRYFAGPER
jgi:hypothetical protein